MFEKEGNDENPQEKIVELGVWTLDRRIGQWLWGT
jgi:hypothetical protein